MSQATGVLSVNDKLPILTDKPVHSGKVRSVYWLSAADSRRIIEQYNYPVHPDTELALMVISDRISAFECIWHGENGLHGVPGKGAVLNMVSQHWFECFKDAGLADSHILDVPHPLVWLVQKAKPVKIEAIARSYITGSMWRAYDKGDRVFCGQTLPEGLQRDQALDELLITPSTKGIIQGVQGVPEIDDVNITREDIIQNHAAFNFNSTEDIALYEKLLREGFDLIREALAKVGQIFVDTKFEFGYVSDPSGRDKLIYMDEVGTPDSSRIWDANDYANGKVVEKSKEEFRQMLLNHFSDSDILINKQRMQERYEIARNTLLPEELIMTVANTYKDIAELITGKPVYTCDDPEAEIIAVLNERYRLIR